MRQPPCCRTCWVAAIMEPVVARAGAAATAGERLPKPLSISQSRMASTGIRAMGRVEVGLARWLEAPHLV